MSELKFCYEKSIQIPKKVIGGITAARAVAYKDKYWNKEQTLKIYFINGNSNQIKQMKEVIEDLINPLSLNVNYTENVYESMIRISFNYGYGSYSYLGTDALFIGKHQETLNIGWDGKDVMYHEFGHALNLTHEHQNPKEGIIWNREQVIKDLSSPPNNWSVTQIEHNVLSKANIQKVDATKFDKDSVMLYYFPNTWTMGDFETNHNTYPSATDRAFLLEKYGERDKTAPVIILNGEENITLEYNQEYKELGATVTDNKDRNIDLTIDGKVDKKPGIYYIVYSAKDSSGNYSEKIRTILVKEKPKNDLLNFIEILFPTKKELEKLNENQLIIIANSLNIEADIKDNKKETIKKITNKLKLI